MSSRPQIVFLVHAICLGAIDDHFLASVAIPDNCPKMFRMVLSIPRMASLSPRIVAISSPEEMLLPSPWLQDICKPPAQICSMWSTAAQPAKIPLSFAIIVASTFSLPPMNGMSMPSSASKALVHLSILEINIRLGPSDASHNCLPLS